MNKQELREQLQKDYTLLAFVDVADVSYNPTAAYQILKNVRKAVFNDNERIVFYGRDPDSKLVAHITQAVNLLDIGEYFVLWYLDIDDAGIPSDKYYVDNSTFCPLLFGHLEVRHNGDVYPCCVSKERIGNGNDNTLTELYHGDQMNRIREELLSGVKSKGCEKCWRHEAEGLQSNRQWHVGKNSQDFYDSWHNELKVRSLDLKPGNVCNFMCRTCNPTSSSLIADEWRRYQKKTGIIETISNRWDGYNEFMWTELNRLLPTMENLDFYGGEPFLLKELKGFLRGAVESGNAGNIRLHFNTNGSVFPADLIDTLSAFKEVDICLSIDNIGKRFELERGGVWTSVEQNILAFKALEDSKPNWQISIFPTVNIQNIYYLDELISWAESHNIAYTLNYLDDPEFLNIDRMTADAKQLVANKYANHPNQALANLSKRIFASPGSDGSAFVRQIKIFDRMRNQNFSNSHPEIATAMGYCS